MIVAGSLLGWSVIVAMVSVWVVQVSIHKIVGVSFMLNRFVPAIGATDLSRDLQDACFRLITMMAWGEK
jgi:hypothetical protein